MMTDLGWKILAALLFAVAVLVQLTVGSAFLAAGF